jgi:hypothetical protein
MAPAPVEMKTNVLTEEEKTAGWQLLAVCSALSYDNRILIPR